MASLCLPIVLGNPYHNTEEGGIIEFFEPVDVANGSSEKRTFPDNAVTHKYDQLCLLDVPVHMIPAGILRFFQAGLDRVSSINIYRHQSRRRKYIAVLKMISSDCADEIYKDYNGHILCTLEQTQCELVPVKRICFSMPHCSTSLCKDKYVGTLESYNVSVDDTCPVCLECIPLPNPMSFTTCCGHRFHMNCMARLEGPQCPVCRFQHDDEPECSTECFVCGWHPAMFDSTSSSNSLTKMPAHSSSSSSSSSIVAESPSCTDIHQNHFYAPHEVDLWLCLICGFTGCGTSHLGHAREHYETTLHTYAMNITSRQVWDFAGDGYVHRLVLNEPSIPSRSGREASASEHHMESAGEEDHLGTQSAHKVMELSHPMSTQDIRVTQAPLNDEEEQSILGHKLEEFARNYNQILTWQLDQNRRLFEVRLQRLRRSQSTHKEGGFLSLRNSSQSVSYHQGGVSDSSRTWRESMLVSLRREKTKFAQQVCNARERLSRSRKELEVLVALNRNLQSNNLEWQRRLDLAAVDLEDAQVSYRCEVPKLEKKVEILMQKLDMAQFPDTGSRKVNS